LVAGHLGRGQGGHSPILQGLLQVLIQGGHLGTEDLRTYFDISGCAGHSVFNIYLVISGIAGQGGIVDFKTYFVPSGTGQGAEGGQCSGSLDATRKIAFSICVGDTDFFSQAHFFFGIWQLIHVLEAAGLQPQAGLELPHTRHIAIAKPSSDVLAVNFPNR